MPPVKSLGAVTSTPPARQSGPVRLDELLQRLATEQGAKLGDELFARIKPNLEGEGQLEPYAPLQNPPKDRLGKALVTAFQERFATAWSARSELPGALTAMLLPYANKKVGDLDLAAIQRDLGPELSAWVQKLGAVPKSAPTSPIADRISYDSIAPWNKKALVEMSGSIAPRLEALDFTLQQYGKPGELDGFQFLGLQHLFASTEQLFSAISELGLHPEDARIIGKNYSTNFRVGLELEAKGMTVDGVSYDLATRTNFAKAMGESIESQLSNIIAKLPKPTGTVHDGHGMHYTWAEPPKPMVLLIDDGAEAIRALHEKFPEYAPFFACVEQTRRGARIAHELADKGELKCAVVNVAESWAKLENESPMIGQSVATEVLRKIDRLDAAGLPRPKEATVIGYGAVGQAVAKALMARGITVHVWDKDPEVLKKLAPGMVGHSDKAEALTHGGVTVSCVGTRTLFPEDWDYLPDGAMLVNAASADDELGPQDLMSNRQGATVIDAHGEGWTVFQGKALSIGHPEAEAHSDTVVRLPSGKELLLASNGFVVNMTGERDPIPPRYIQLTRALLLMGAITATRATKPGLIDVPEDWQKALVAHIESQLATSGESLQKPLWDAVVESKPNPPAAALELVRSEKAKAAEEKATAEKKKAAKTGPAPAEPLPAPHEAERQEGSKVYGYQLGRAVRDSFEWQVAGTLGLPDHELTVEAWALYHATRFANQTMDWHMRVQLNPDEPGRPTDADVLAPPANAAAASSAREATLFEAYFGLNLASVTEYALRSRLKAEPTPEQLTEAMAKIARQAGVSLKPYLEYLKTGTEPRTLAIAQALAPLV